MRVEGPGCRLQLSSEARTLGWKLAAQCFVKIQLLGCMLSRCTPYSWSKMSEAMFVDSQDLLLSHGREFLQRSKLDCNNVFLRPADVVLHTTGTLESQLRCPIPLLRHIIHTRFLVIQESPWWISQPPQLEVTAQGS